MTNISKQVIARKSKIGMLINQEIKMIERKLNNRPRKSYKFENPL